MLTDAKGMDNGGTHDRWKDNRKTYNRWKDDGGT